MKDYLGVSKSVKIRLHNQEIQDNLEQRILKVFLYTYIILETNVILVSFKILFRVSSNKTGNKENIYKRSISKYKIQCLVDVISTAFGVTQISCSRHHALQTIFKLEYCNMASQIKSHYIIYRLSFIHIQYYIYACMYIIDAYIYPNTSCIIKFHSQTMMMVISHVLFFLIYLFFYYYIFTSTMSKSISIEMYSPVIFFSFFFHLLFHRPKNILNDFLHLTKLSRVIYLNLIKIVQST